MKNRELKPPRPPRCLCRDLAHFILGVVSPSLLFKYSTGISLYQVEGISEEDLPLDYKKAKKYLSELDAYQTNRTLRDLDRKLYNRTMTKTEYHQYCLIIKSLSKSRV